MGLYDESTDEVLIERLRAGESAISDYLMEKYKNLVRLKARAMFLVGGDTDDLIQEGMIGLFKAVRDYDSAREASFRTFAELCIERQLYTAVQNSNRRKHQPLNTYISLSDEEEDETLQMNWKDNPETILVDQESASQKMQEILGSLSKLEKEVLAEYLKGKSYEEIAQALDKTPKSVDNALKRIRQKVKSRVLTGA